MATTISLSGLNGDWAVNAQSGTNRVWTRGIYSIVYSDSMFGSTNAGWIVKITNGVEIFGIVSDTDPWVENPTIIWNPNATGYDNNTTANMVFSVIEQVNPVDINPAYYKCVSVDSNVWSGYKMNWEENNGWVAESTLTENLNISGFTPEIDKIYNINTTALIYLHPDEPTAEVIATSASASDILSGKTAVLNGELTTGTMENKGTVSITPSTEEQTFGAGYYSDITITGDSDLIHSNIRAGITIFGVEGSLEEGTDADLTNLTAENIKSGITINGISGIFTADATATANDIATGKTAYVNGQLVTGTYVVQPSASEGGFSVYECASVSEGSSEPDTIRWYRPDESYYDFVLYDKESTGSNRVFVHEEQFDQVPSIEIESIMYNTQINRWTRQYGIYAESDLSGIEGESNCTDANASVSVICAAEWTSDVYSSLKLEAVGGEPSDPTWSGYKMTWEESPGEDSTAIVGHGGYDTTFTLSDANATGGSRVFNSDGIGYIEYVEGKWQLMDYNMAMYMWASDCTDADATVSEICNATWTNIFDGTGELTLTPVGGSDPVLGWVKASELTEGLAIVGFTPTVGKVYNEDTTALVFLHPNEPTAEVIATSASASDILSGKTAVLNGELTTGTMENKGTVSITPSTEEQTFGAGYYSGITVSSIEADGSEGGGAGGGFMSFYECASLEQDKRAIGFFVEHSKATETDPEGNVNSLNLTDAKYIIYDDSKTGSERVFLNEEHFDNVDDESLALDVLGWDGSRWIIAQIYSINDSPHEATGTANSDCTNPDATLAEIAAANWNYSPMFGDDLVAGAITVLEELGDVTGWTGYEMMWKEASGDTPAGYVKSETLTEGLSVVGATPVVGKIYNSNTTITVEYIVMAADSSSSDNEYYSFSISGSSDANLNGLVFSYDQANRYWSATKNTDDIPYVFRIYYSECSEDDFIWILQDVEHGSVPLYCECELKNPASETITSDDIVNGKWVLFESTSTAAGITFTRCD